MQFLLPLSNALIFILIILLVLEIVLRIRAMRTRNKDHSPNPIAGPAPENTPETAFQSAPKSLPEPTSQSNQTPQVAEISGQALLDEAEIYLQYGRYEQAAIVLRWYVDMQPNDSRAINQLLDTYLSIEDYAAYTDFLGSLDQNKEQTPEELRDQKWWEQRVFLGLQKDPSNLELLVLAEKLGLKVTAPDSDQPVTPANALAIVSRSKDPVYSVAVLRSAIMEDPFSLPVYAELLRICYQQRDQKGFEDAMLLMSIALGDKGKPILNRMLRAGHTLGQSLLWDQLESYQGNQKALLAIAKERGLTVSPHLSMG